MTPSHSGRGDESMVGLTHDFSFQHFRDATLPHTPLPQGALILRSLFLFERDVVVPLVER
jgi:hypothetical protein